MQNSQDIIERIQELANLRGISTNKALVESGAGKDFISDLKKGQTPTVTRVLTLSDYFNVSVNYLITGNKKVADPEVDGRLKEVFSLLEGFTEQELETAFSQLKNIAANKKTKSTLDVNAQKTISET